MKIKDYLESDPETKEKLRNIATFFMLECTNSKNGGCQLSPFEDEKIRWILPEARKAIRGEIAYPTVARICLTTSCLHNCSGCLFADNRTKEKYFLDSNNFGTLLKGVLSLKVKLIDLTGGGEPTLHPEFKAFARMCTKEGFKLALLSNGTWTDPDLIDVLSDGFSFIRINMDASNQEVYNRIHRPTVQGEFQRMLNNLEKLVMEKEKRKSDLIVGAKVSLNQANMNFLDETINLAKDLGMNYIQFHIKRNDLEAILPEQVKSVDRLLLELKNIHRPFMVYGEVNEEETQDICWISELQLTIDPKGDIYSCPHYPDHLQATCLRSIFNEPTDKLWFSKEHINEIDHLNRKTCLERTCRWLSYDRLIRQRINKS